MNRPSLIVKVLVIATSLTATAYANHWAGKYIGANAGFTLNNNKLKSHHLGFTNPSEHCNNTSNFLTLGPGIQGGYLTQYSPSYVVGLDADFNFNLRQKDTLGCRSAINRNVYDRFTFKNRMQAALKGRAGYELKWNKLNLLPYFTIGLSLVNVELAYKNENNDHYFNNAIIPGLLLGTGVEWTLNQKWSLRAGYSYNYYGNNTQLRIPSIYALADNNGKGRLTLNSHKFSLGFNYWM